MTTTEALQAAKDINSNIYFVIFIAGVALLIAFLLPLLFPKLREKEKK